MSIQLRALSDLRIIDLQGDLRGPKKNNHLEKVVISVGANGLEPSTSRM